MMKLSISNIAWDEKENEAVYGLMERLGFRGLEIAPTKIFPENPYEHLEEARAWADSVHQTYGLSISSMQSIWYGRTESLFGTEEERASLLEYTKMAIDFAEAIGCRNLVFGCPKNRNVPEGRSANEAIPFFKELGDYAYLHHTVIGMEANPEIYGTNYINTTEQAFRLIQEVNSDGFRLNLDVGTMIQNEESVSVLDGNVPYVNHVHISEPYLKIIEKRELHKSLLKLLADQGYDGYVSIEMGLQEDVRNVEEAMGYVRSLGR